LQISQQRKINHMQTAAATAAAPAVAAAVGTAVATAVTWLKYDFLEMGKNNLTACIIRWK
jgi:hypothetical protein